MNFKTLHFTLIILACTLKLSAQPWIPHLDKTGTYSLVTETGKPVNNTQYDYITPFWGGTQYAYWQSKGQVGCLFPNKVSITFERNRATYQTQMAKPVMMKDNQGIRTQEDYVYLIAFSAKNLLVNIKTGKYLVDEPNSDDKQALRMMPYFPLREGLMKIHIKENWVNFVNLEFNSVFANPIKKGEMVTPNLFIAQDSATNKFGLIDAKSNIVVPYIYEKMKLSPIENHIIVGKELQRNTKYPAYKYGLLDQQGKLVLDTLYYEIRTFANNLYIINTKEKSGVLNQFLEPVIPLEQQRIEQVKDFYVDQDKYLFVLNSRGRQYSPQNFIILDSAGNFVFKDNGTNFYIQSECKCFSLTKHNGEKFVYNTSQGIQFAFRDTFMDIFCTQNNGDPFFVRRKTEEIQLRSSSGEIIHTYPYNAALPLKSIAGYYQVYKDEKRGIIDPSGEIIAPIIYDAVYDLPIKGRDRNITGFRTGAIRQYGIYDTESKKWSMFHTEEEAIGHLYPPEFKIIAGKNNLYGVVRSNGKRVIPEQYQIIKQMKDRPLFACYDQNTQKWSIIGANNDVVFTFDKTGDQNPPIANILKSTDDLAIQNGAGTLFLENDTCKKLAYFDLLYIDGICIISFENKGWVTMLKPNINPQAQKEVWINYTTGKAYLEK